MHTEWVGGLALGLYTVVGLLALQSSAVRSDAVRLGIMAGLLVSVAMIIISAAIGTNPGHGIAALWTGLLLLLIIVVLIRQILLLPTVTIQSIYGVVSSYLMIGLMFAAFYSAIYYFHGKSFFADGQPGTPATFQYFSFTTLTTLGYGDFTAAQSGSRAIAMIEAMTGQIFLATLVARLVAAFRPSTDSPRPGQSDQN